MLHERIDGNLELIHLAKQGDSASFGMLLEGFRPRLYATALNILHDIHSANDAVQDTFVLALTKLQTLREPAAFTGWLFAILRNVCHGYLRESANQISSDFESFEFERHPLADSESVEELVDRMLLRSEIFAAMSGLSEPLRAVIMLRYLSSLDSYENIAVILGIPVGTVRSRLAQARTMLLGHFLNNRCNDDGSWLVKERREQYLYWLGRLYRGDRDRFFARYAENVGYTLQGKWLNKANLVYEFDGDVAAGTTLHPFRFMVSGNITVVEAQIKNAPETPFRCPPLGVEVSVQHHDKIIRLHHYASQEVPAK